jgi:formiminotetrahydrofolate cyclodeaminase
MAMSDIKEQIKNHTHNLKIVTTEEDLAFMRRNREKFIQQMGQETYDRLEKKLEDYISNRKQPQSAVTSEA